MIPTTEWSSPRPERVHSVQSKSQKVFLDLGQSRPIPKVWEFEKNTWLSWQSSLLHNPCKQFFCADHSWQMLYSSEPAKQLIIKVKLSWTQVPLTEEWTAFLHSRSGFQQEWKLKIQASLNGVLELVSNRNGNWRNKLLCMECLPAYIHCCTNELCPFCKSICQVEAFAHFPTLSTNDYHWLA